MIGGADKYMATCRRCHNTNVKIPCSPRPTLKCSNNKENSLALSNTIERKSELGNKSPKRKSCENGGPGEFCCDDLPVKKALFDQNCDEDVSQNFSIAQ